LGLDRYGGTGCLGWRVGIRLERAGEVGVWVVWREVL